VVSAELLLLLPCAAHSAWDGRRLRSAGLGTECPERRPIDQLLGHHRRLPCPAMSPRELHRDQSLGCFHQETAARPKQWRRLRGCAEPWMNLPWGGGDTVIGASTHISLRRVIMGLREIAMSLGVLEFNHAIRVFELWQLVMYRKPPSCTRGVTDARRPSAVEQERRHRAGRGGEAIFEAPVRRLGYVCVRGLTILPAVGSIAQIDIVVLLGSRSRGHRDQALRGAPLRGQGRVVDAHRRSQEHAYPVATPAGPGPGRQAVAEIWRQGRAIGLPDERHTGFPGGRRHRPARPWR